MIMSSLDIKVEAMAQSLLQYFQTIEMFLFQSCSRPSDRGENIIIPTFASRTQSHSQGDKGDKTKITLIRFSNALLCNQCISHPGNAINQNQSRGYKHKQPLIDYVGAK